MVVSQVDKMKIWTKILLFFRCIFQAILIILSYSFFDRVDNGGVEGGYVFSDVGIIPVYIELIYILGIFLIIISLLFIFKKYYLSMYISIFSSFVILITTIYLKCPNNYRWVTPNLKFSLPPHCARGLNAGRVEIAAVMVLIICFIQLILIFSIRNKKITAD